MFQEAVRHTGRGGRAMTPEELEAFLGSVAVGTIAYTTQDGWPDMRPLNFGYYNGCFYFHVAKARGEKLQHWQNGQRVCLSFYTESDRIGQDFICTHQSALVYGTLQWLDVRPEETLEECKAGITAMCNVADLGFKAMADNMDRCIHGIGIWKVIPEYKSGKMVCFSSLPEEHKK